MARIYVSSTFSDLKEHREQVRHALRRMGHEDVAMEYYVAEDQRPLDRCLADVRACDVYIGVFAWRYGFIPAGSDRSITELELRAAVAAGKECLIFVLAEDAPWPPNQIEFEAYDKIKALRDELSQRSLVSFFRDKADLEAQVSQAINAWEKRHGVERTWTNWEQYRRALFEAYRWVRLAVIAGAKQDRITRIPLSDVFVPQMAQRGRPTYEIPDEVLRLKRELFGHRPPEAQRALAADETTTQDASELDSADDDQRAIESVAAFPESMVDVLGRERMQVVLGGPGSGKSTLLYAAILSLCADQPDGLTLPALQHRPLPLLIELRQYVLKRSPDFLTYLITHLAERYGVTVDHDSLATLLSADRRALLIFDGLDEIFDPAERADVIQKFQMLARRYPQANIVVSSRIVGYDPIDLGLAGFEHYTLLDFTTLHIRQFVPRWYQYYTWDGDDRDAHGLTQRILDNPRLQDLAGNPLLLTMMAIIYKHQDLPEQRWKLYERCTEVLLEDWDIKRKSIDRKTLPLDINIRAAQKAEMLQRVALYMLENGQAGRELNAIAYQPLLRILSDYLRERYHKAPAEAEAIAQGILGHLRERTYILAEIGEGIFGFVHRTFMEYFAAVYLKAEFNAKEADYEWLKHSVFDAYWRRDEWQEVLFLLSAILVQQGSPFQKIISHLARNSLHLENLAFTARCLAEAGTIEDPKQAQQLMLTLVRTLAWYAQRPQARPASTAMDAGMTAFAMLAPLIDLPPPARSMIRELEQAKGTRERIAAWQMGLALRSRQERREFALAALKDKQEVVRRGAIATLEREWSGSEQVGRALIEVVRSDGNVRVRQPALEALARGWPEEEGVLAAIERRIKDETAFTYLLWLIEYLAANWRGHRKAYALLLALSEWNKATSPFDHDLVVQAAVRALAQGWRDDPRTLPQLHAWALGDRRASFRVVALSALIDGWREDAATLPLLHRCALHDREPGIRKAASRMIGTEWPQHPDTLPLLHDQAVRSSRADVREAALRVIVQGWRNDQRAASGLSFDGSDGEIVISRFFGRSDLATLPLLQDRAVHDASADVRSVALEAIAKGWHQHPSTLPLLQDRAVQDVKPGVRWTAIMLIVERWRKDDQTLPLLHDRMRSDGDQTIRRLSVMLMIAVPWLSFRRGTSHTYNHRYQRMAQDLVRSYTAGFSQMSRLLHRDTHWTTDPQTRSILHERARNDPDAIVRGLAAEAVKIGWRDDPDTIGLLRERQTVEPDAQVQALLQRLLS